METMYCTQSREAKDLLEALLSGLAPEKQDILWEYISRRETMIELRFKMVFSS